MAEPPTIVLSLPATLRFRDVAVRCVAACSRLVGLREDEVPATETGRLDLHREFDAQFISAFSEIFNNIAIHSFEGRLDGTLEIEIDPSPTRLEVRISEGGAAFDIDAVPTPELDSLPEGGMGIHIARACLDELDYSPGPPNRWRLIKHLHAQEEP